MSYLAIFNYSNFKLYKQHATELRYLKQSCLHFLAPLTTIIEFSRKKIYKYKSIQGYKILLVSSPKYYYSNIRVPVLFSKAINTAECTHDEFELMMHNTFNKNFVILCIIYNYYVSQDSIETQFKQIDYIMLSQIYINVLLGIDKVAI